MTVEVLIRTVVQNGLAIGLVLFWAWEASKREARMRERTDKIETVIWESMQRQNADAVRALTTSAEVMSRIDHTLRSLSIEPKPMARDPHADNLPPTP